MLTVVELALRHRREPCSIRNVTWAVPAVPDPGARCSGTTSAVIYLAEVLSIGASIAAWIAFGQMENAGQDQKALCMTGINRHKAETSFIKAVPEHRTAFATGPAGVMLAEQSRNRRSG
jgi:hypothetical protein